MDGLGDRFPALARTLSERLGIPHIELDALHWGPDWAEVPDDTFRGRTTDATALPEWVADGNYGVVRDIVWLRAVMVFSREELWSGNRERLWTQLFTRESVFWWQITTYRRRRR